MDSHDRNTSYTTTSERTVSAFSAASDTSTSTRTSQATLAAPDPPRRTLVLCFDGTGDKFGADNSNVVQLFSMLKKDDRSQMVYYQSGIGTYMPPQSMPLMKKISRIVDDMIAWNIPTHVMDGYEFLMQNYTAGDRICLFGFSRGAYTARSLAGMVHKVGLLPAGNIQQIPFAYKMYTKTGDEGWRQSTLFKRTFSTDVDIEFVGVWDTVNSVGIIPCRLPFTTSNTIIKHFRHAVALDERRAYFKANLWHRPDGENVKCDIRAKNKRTVFSYDEDAVEDRNELCYGDSQEVTDVKEVWFAGCHCDVGGGAIKNGTPHTLSRIPLRWMIRECFKTNSGILFKRESLRELGLNPDTITKERPDPLPVDQLTLHKRTHWWPSLLSWLFPAKPKTDFTRTDSNGVVHKDVHGEFGELIRGTEEEEELKDAMAPKYDQLHQDWAWWLLEILPLFHRYQKDDNSWSWWFGWNRGAGRRIPRQDADGVDVHRSVRVRMGARFGDGKKYKPRTRLNQLVVRWVD